MTNIELPEDNKRSKLPKSEQTVKDEEFVTAAERFAAFREQYPNGWHDTAIEKVIEHPDGHVTYIMFAKVWKERPGLASMMGPDATAWAQGSTKSENAIVSGSPLESADTIARSRAIKNLGILVTLAKAAPATLGAPQPDAEIGADLTAARERAEMSQRDLATAMTGRSFKWSQATVSQIEKGTRPLRYNEAQHLAELIRFGGVR